METNALTPRQFQVLLMLSEGLSNKQISQNLSISVRSVEAHNDDIYSKLNLRNRTEAARYIALNKPISVCNRKYKNGFAGRLGKYD